jgi:hypothetical protein
VPYGAKRSLLTARGLKSPIFLTGLVSPIENLPSRYGTSFMKYYLYADKRGLPAPGRPKRRGRMTRQQAVGRKTRRLMTNLVGEIYSGRIMHQVCIGIMIGEQSGVGEF